MTNFYVVLCGNLIHNRHPLLPHTPPTLQQCTLPLPKPQISLKHMADWEYNEHNSLTHSYSIWSIPVPLIIIHKCVNSAPSFQHQLFLGQHTWALQHIYPSTRAEASGDFQRYFQSPPRGTCPCHAATHTHHYQVKDQALLCPHQAAYQHWGTTSTISTGTTPQPRQSIERSSQIHF